MGQVVYSPNYKAFVTLVSDVDKQGLPVQSEEYADLTGTTAGIFILSLSLSASLSLSVYVCVCVCACVCACVWS